MDSHSQMLVRHLIASRLQIEDEESIADTRRLDDLALDMFDLVLVAVELEELAGGGGPFPVGDLAQVETVGDVVALVDDWLQSDTVPRPIEGSGGDHGRHAA
jgi:acyl carrier protein